MMNGKYGGHFAGSQEVDHGQNQLTAFNPRILSWITSLEHGSTECNPVENFRVERCRSALTIA
jgi:hypothetical protein